MFAVAPYLIQIKDEQKQPQDLWDFYNKQDLRKVLLDYYKGQIGTYQPSISNPNRMFSVSKVCKGTNTSVSGTYKTGQFGFESEIYSTSKKVIAHNRKKDEADMLPFNFSFYFPQNTITEQRKRGLLLLGRFHNLGIRQLALPHLQVYFKNRFPKFSLQIERVVPNLVVETLLTQGTLKTIRLVKRVPPSDLADIFTDSDKESIGDVELVIRSKRKSKFKDIDWLLNAFQNKTHPSQIMTLQSFKQDNIKLEIDIDGRSRIVDLGNTGKLSSNIEFNNLTPDATGHPKLIDWLKEADDLAKGVVTAWGVKNAKWDSVP